MVPWVRARLRYNVLNRESLHVTTQLRLTHAHVMRDAPSVHRALRHLLPRQHWHRETFCPCSLPGSSVAIDRKKPFVCFAYLSKDNMEHLQVRSA